MYTWQKNSSKHYKADFSIFILQDIQLFAHSLVANIDFAACRYVLVLSNYIESVDWQDVEDFRAFSTSIYPFILVGIMCYKYIVITY